MQTKLITITAGSVKNAYIQLATAMDLIPGDTIGGNNKSDLAPKLLEVNYGGGLVSYTDVARDKKILRDRTTARAFMMRHKLQEGDQVSVIRTGAYSLTIAPV